MAFHLEWHDIVSVSGDIHESHRMIPPLGLLHEVGELFCLHLEDPSESGCEHVM